MEKLKNKMVVLLRWSEKYAKTDMIYLARGGFWLTLGQIISSLSSFVLVLCFANLLPKEVYGTYQYILSVIGILAASALSGINISLIQSISNGFEGNLIPAVKTKIRWALIGSLASIILASYYYFQQNTILSASFFIVSIFLPFIDSFGVYESYLQGKKLFKESAKYRIVSQVIAVASLTATLSITKNIFVILFVYFTAWTSLRLLLLKRVCEKFEINKNIDPQAISFGKHLSVMDIFQSIAGQADKIMVFHYFGAADLAVYAIASAPISQIKSFLQNIKTLAFPKLSSASVENIKKHLPRQIFRAEIIISFIVVTYIVAAPSIIPVFFPQYINSIKFSQILSLTLLTIPRTLLSASLSAKKQIESLYIIKIFGPVGKLTIYFMLINVYGLTGLILGRVLAEFFLVGLYNFYFRKIK